MKLLKRIPSSYWVAAAKGLAVAVSAFYIFMLFRIQAIGTKNAEQARVISQRTQEIAEQAKAIAEQNKSIAVESQAHIDCIADLFARYTRDGRAITIIDLSACQAVATAAQDQTGQPTTTDGTGTAPATNQGSTPQTASQPAPQQEEPEPPAPSMLCRIANTLTFGLVSCQ